VGSDCGGGSSGRGGSSFYLGSSNSDQRATKEFQRVTRTGMMGMEGRETTRAVKS
jgi:hypothetical protein